MLLHLIILVHKEFYILGKIFSYTFLNRKTTKNISFMFRRWQRPMHLQMEKITIENNYFYLGSRCFRKVKMNEGEQILIYTAT